MPGIGAPIRPLARRRDEGGYVLPFTHSPGTRLHVIAPNTTFRPGDPLYPEVAGMRARWRIQSGDAERAAEAIEILDELDAWAVTSEPMLMRARAAVVAGRPLYAWSSLANLARALDRPVWDARPPALRAHLARSALEIARELPPHPRASELRSQLRESLER